MKPSVLVSAVVLVNKDNKILMTIRPLGKKMAGYWEFPGGKVEKGENFCQTAVRELQEELLIKINANDLQLFDEVNHCYDDFKLVMQVFICKNWKGDIIPQENQLYQWFEQNQIDYNKIIPADIELVRKVYEYV